jgi:hypothetical protein
MANCSNGNNNNKYNNLILELLFQSPSSHVSERHHVTACMLHASFSIAGVSGCRQQTTTKCPYVRSPAQFDNPHFSCQVVPYHWQVQVHGVPVGLPLAKCDNGNNTCPPADPGFMASTVPDADLGY